MPLESHVPKIDDRRYDDIMTEVRTRIARYTPEWAPVWTNVNDSDPGITMVQVFAWLSDMLLYRLGRVPEQNYLKFLELLGIELKPASPAVAEITFPLSDTVTEPYVIIPPRTQVSAEAEDGSAIVFETERSLVALAACLAAVKVYDGYQYHERARDKDAFDETADEASQGFEPFGSLAKEDSALMLGFDRVLPTKVDVDLMVWAAESASASGSHVCGLSDTPAYPSAQLIWEFWNGREWHPVNLLKDETLALTRSGHIRLQFRGKDTMQPLLLPGDGEQYYWLRARLERSWYERPPKVLAIRTNTVTAIQAESVQDEVLGGSNGTPNQTFRLANTPVVHDTLVLEVDEGIDDDAKQWTRVEDFLGSTPTDRHYVLNRTTGEIRFGDGLFHGQIPVANVNNPGANVIAREYRFGGGARGNIAAGNLNTLLTSISGVDESSISNLRAAYGGRDEELLAEARERAQRSLKSKCRAVTAEDFEHFAKEAANIKRAKALPLYHPGFPDVEVPGVITVVVVPDGTAPNPMPSEGTLKTVCAYLNERRLLTTELYVVKPTYRNVRIEVDIIAQNNADLGEVKTQVEDALVKYFNPLTGGEDNQGWPFGGDIYYSLVFQKVFTVPGIQRIKQLLISVEGDTYPDCEDIEVKSPVLVYSTEHDVTVNYAFE